MTRRKIHLAAAGALLLIGWGLHKAGWFSSNGNESREGRPTQVNSADPMDTPSGWRYRQNQPHHWRYIMLQN
ncbi:MAG TPA: hypothetical protein VMF69_29005 [Gemmataceae bacterium]|nr:hypothetical protein [Gemmataceae bacterium]